jgi:hypothetical protein
MRDEELKAEFSLLHAVLLTAVKDLRGNNKTEWQRAKEWFLDDQRHHVFSFVMLCEIIGQDPGRIRKQLGLAERG